MNFLKKLLKKDENKKASVLALEGEVQRRKGLYKKALKNFNIAIKLEPNNDMFYASRSIAKKELKDYKGALLDIQKAIQIQPSVSKYQKILAELQSMQ